MLYQGNRLLVTQGGEPGGFDQDRLIRLTDFFKNQ